MTDQPYRTESAYTPSLDELKTFAQTQAENYALMLKYDEGVGGLGVRHPERFEQMLAWDGITDNRFADVVLRLIGEIEAVRAEERERALLEAADAYENDKDGPYFPSIVSRWLRERAAQIRAQGKEQGA